MKSILNFLAGVLLTCGILTIVLLRIAFGVALYVIAFGAAYIVLWELGIL